MKRRMLSLLLVLVLVISMMPISAFAGGWYMLYVFDEDGTWYQVPSRGKGTKVDNQGNGWEWDPITKTLTLHNASLISPSGGIEICAGATVRMDDGSVNVVSARSAGGFAGRGDLTFIGEASLEALSGSGASDTGYISADGKCTIEGSTIIANTRFSCSGLDLTNGSISCNSFSAGSTYRGNSAYIANSNVTVEGYSFDSSGETQYRGGFYAGNMEVTNSTIITRNLGDAIQIGSLSAINSSITLERHPAVISPEVLRKYYHCNTELGYPNVSYTGGKVWVEIDNLKLDHSSLVSNMHIKCDEMPSLKNVAGGFIIDGFDFFIAPSEIKQYEIYLQDVVDGKAILEPVSIIPTDTISSPQITTENLQPTPNGVMDVPYQAIIQTNLGENVSKTHELVIESGELPPGLLLEADGELHGIPSQSGEYEFTVALKEKTKQDILDKRSYKVIIKESTPENVAEVNTSSQGYRLLDPLPDVIDFDKVESGAEFTFRSEGPYKQLDAVYIDGDELTPGVDYSASEGSCTIVLSEMGYGGRSSGRHVISATFEQPSIQGNFTIKKTAQVVTFENPKPRPIPKYSIKLDCTAGGAAVVSNKSIEAGKTVTITAKPNYGWEINQVTAGSAKLTKKGDKYTFMMPASAVTAKVSFKRKGAAEGTGMPFFDVRTTDWFYEPVKVVYDAGLMTGTARNAFSPNHPALREMIATILYRHAGSPSVEGRCKFTDVKAGSYYEKAVIWAEQNEIISGVSSTKFNPSGKITRQELVTLMYRYAGSPEGSGDLSTFTDIDKLSAWAENAASWAIENGIVTGKGNNRLDPQGNATRAEIATVLKRFIDLMELYESMEIELSAQNLQMSIGDTQTIQLSTSKPVVCKPEWGVSTGDVVGIEPDGMSCQIEALNPGHVTVYAKVYGRTVQCVVDVDGLVEPDSDPDDGTDEPIPPDDYEPDPPTVSVNNQIMSASKENRTLSVTIPQTNDMSLSWIPWDGCTGFIIPKEQADGSTLPNIELPCEGINLDENATLVDSNTQSKTYEIVLEIFLSESTSLIYTLNITVLN